MRLRRWSHWTVRTRMVVTIVAITALALVVALVTAALLLRGVLVGQIDKQLDGGGRWASQQAPPGEAKPPPKGLGGPGGFGGEIPRVYYYDTSGAFVSAESNAFGTPDELTGLGDLAAHAADGSPYTVAETDGTAFRAKVVPSAGGGYTVLAMSLTGPDSTVTQLLLIGGGVSLFILVLLAVGASWVVRLGLRPLTRMETTAVSIADGDLDSRIPDADPHTETGRLGRALNTMLGRIQQALDDRAASEARLRQFLADASHELRTPLTSIKGFAELYRRGGAPPGPVLDETVGRIEDEAKRMSLLVDDLMLLASLDKQRPLDRGPADLLAVAADALRDAHVREPNRFIALEPLHNTGDVLDAVTVPGDEPRLRQVLTNLVTNALRHTPPDAAITVRLGRSTQDYPYAAQIGERPTGEVAVLEVADTGPGLDPDVAERVFERLYRADPSRVRDRRVQASGAGLGLSIVAAIVTAHGGCVQLDTALGAGATFRVLLPLE